MPSELLFEIGTEEIPAGMASGGAAQLAEGIGKRLLHHRLEHGNKRAFSTPRRLVVVIEDVAVRQADIEDLVTGPPRSAAFDAAGAPTKAAIGFAAKHGQDAAALTVVETAKGAYIAVRRVEKGRPALELLPSILEEAVAGIAWKKSMRWGDPASTGDVAFVRPVHWIVALFGGQVVRVSFAGLVSAALTRGHRFLAPAPFAVTGFDDLQKKLRAAFVIVDDAERRTDIAAKLAALASEAGGALEAPAALLDEVTHLVEYPVGVLGRFDEQFVRDIPKEVIVAAMTGHQRYFPIVREGGALAPAFATIAGTIVKDPATVRRGNERVLNARLEDGRFFFVEDSKHPLVESVGKLAGMVFHKQLGTMKEKTDRLVVLAGRLAEVFAQSASIKQQCERAALLCKADLTTKMVGEFPDLQGVMGRTYARKDGEDEAVAEAIFEHYLPRGEKDPVPAGVVGRIVGLADRLDTLVGGFGAGLAPTGAGDPFGLRRAALGAIRLVTRFGQHVKLSELVALAEGGYGGRFAVSQAALDFFRGRLRAYYVERYPVGLVDMILEVSGKFDDPADLDFHLAEAKRALDDGLLSKVAEPVKRARNITKDVKLSGFDPAHAKDAEERTLNDVYVAVRGELDVRLHERRYYEAYYEVDKRLRDPLHAFFEKVFVMDENPAIRQNRLGLLRGIHEVLAPLGDFSRLSL